MPRRKPESNQPSEQAEAASFSDLEAIGGAGATVESENENRSEEVQVVQLTPDDRVRRGGWTLTEDGWVAEGDPVPAEDEGEPAPEDEEE